MPVIHYTLTLSGASENVATALGLTAETNIPLKAVSFQAGGAADVFIGGPTGTISSTNYGVRAITGQGPVYLEGQGDGGPIKLNQIQVQGTAAQRLHILAVTF